MIKDGRLDNSFTARTQNLTILKSGEFSSMSHPKFSSAWQRWKYCCKFGFIPGYIDKFVPKGEVPAVNLTFLGMILDLFLDSLNKAVYEMAQDSNTNDQE
jgi:hypothetical protein